VIFRLQYSIERISAAIGCLSTNRCMLYSTFAVKYRTRCPVYAMPTQVPVKSNTITVLLMQPSMFNWTYLRCNWWCIDKSMRVILHICRHIQDTTAGSRNFNSGPRQNQRICRLAYFLLNNKINIYMFLVHIRWQCHGPYTPNLLPHTANIIRFELCHL
jgi:hypothetical protein